MSSVMRLVWTYFSATPLIRALSMLGIIFVAMGVAGYLIYPNPDWSYGVSGGQLWMQSLLLALPWLGFVFLLSASALMPGIIEKFVIGRRIWILPHARARLLLSTVIPAIALAALTAVAAAAAFLSFTGDEDIGRIFTRTALMAFVDVGLIYTAIWLVGKTSGVWRLAGMLWTVACVLIPIRYFAGIPPFSPLEAFGLASWAVFGAFVLSGGRMRHAFAGLRRTGAKIVARTGGNVRYVAGREADLLLGTNNPWGAALGQIVPIFAVAWLVSETHMWIAFLVVFSAISGATASQAARRSRRFWLRYAMDRAAIAACVERLYWRYNAKSLAVLLLVFLALAGWFDFPASVQVLGFLLLVLGCAVSTYLGLMTTTGLGWFESILCILTLATLGAGAIALLRFNLIVTGEILCLLGVLVVVYRSLSAARWSRLDWMRTC